jgi:plastocyanin
MAGLRLVVVSSAAVALLVAAIAVVALPMCGGRDPVKQPEARLARAAAALGAQPGEAVAGSDPFTAAIVATDNRFDATEVSVEAGAPVTLELRNNGTVRHNWRLRGVRGPNGEEIVTRLVPSGETVTITFAIADPGRYDFVCDVHPSEQTGVLLVR